MITPSSVAFPNNIVLALKQEFDKIDVDIPVYMRPIRKGDPVQCIGITAALWQPVEDSYEMLGGSRTGASLNSYLIGIQVLVQDMDEERGLQNSATLAGIIRGRLSSDPAVRVALHTLLSTEFGYTERFAKGTITGQRFLSNEIEGSFYYLSNLEYLVETETS